MLGTVQLCRHLTPAWVTVIWHSAAQREPYNTLRHLRYLTPPYYLVAPQITVLKVYASIPGTIQHPRHHLTKPQVPPYNTPGTAL